MVEEISNQTRQFLQSMTAHEITDWSPFENIVELKKLKKNEHFFRYPQVCEDVAIIKTGLVRLYFISEEGEEKTFSFIAENSFVVDFFLSGEQKSGAKLSVQAIEPTEIYTFSYERFVDMMKADPVWRDIYQSVLSKSYILKTKRVMEFVQFNAKQRLKRFLNNKKVHIHRIPKAYLASYLGIRPPSLSRILKEMKQEPYQEIKEGINQQVEGA